MGRAGRAGMHTEGSVIFSAPSIYDQRGNRDERWRWVATKNLLDPARAEPSRSSILALFDDYEQSPQRKLKLPIGRSKDRRVGTECVNKCRFRWSPFQ